MGEDTYRLFVDAMVFPTIMLFGDTYWRGRTTDEPAFQRRRMPPVGETAPDGKVLATFVPFLGPSERPREIPGLAFSSSPR